LLVWFLTLANFCYYLTQLPPKMTLSSKVVKSDSKIIISHCSLRFGVNYLTDWCDENLTLLERSNILLFRPWWWWLWMDKSWLSQRIISWRNCLKKFFYYDLLSWLLKVSISSTFYNQLLRAARRSQKRKKTLMTWLCTFGIYACKNWL